MAKQIEGQVSLWDIESIDNCSNDNDILINKSLSENPILFAKLSRKETNTKIDNLVNTLIITGEQQDFLTKNLIMKNENLSRLIIHCSGGLIIELAVQDSYKTIWINRNGIKEFEYNKKASPLPMDKIIYYRNDFKANEIQEKKLLEIQDGLLKVIRRKGDENIIALTEDKVISINSKGWVLEFNNISVCETEDIINRNITEDEIRVGDSVELQYGEGTFKGVVTSIYNNGDTINCIFDNKHSAFYKKCVKKLINNNKEFIDMEK